MKKRFLNSYIDKYTNNMNKYEWLKFRKSGIGGSDASAVAGINPWKSPLNIYLDKTSEIIDDSVNFRMELGNRLEQLVADLFAEETGKKVRNVNGILRNDKYKFAFANIDRAVVGEKSILECKTTNSFASKEWEEGIPPHYEIQCMHYMAVTGAEKCYVAVLIGNQEFKIHTLLRDEETIEYLMKIEEKFWEKYITGDSTPLPDGSNQYSDYLRNKYKDSNGEKINLEYLNNGKEKIENYFKLKEEKKSIENKIKEIEQIFQKEMKENERAVLGDYKITWKTTIRNNFNAKKFKEEYPELHDKYISSTSYRRFSIK